MQPRPQIAQPILPQAARPATIQPHAGNEFALPANFTLKPRGSGQPLPEPIQKKMETFFNTSFADVRIHVGHEAPSIGALAFTHGTDLYFAPGQYNPQSTQGQQLLGHELTHVVQQRAGRVRNPLGAGVAVVQDPALEAEAERMGLQAATQSQSLQAKKAHPQPERSASGSMAYPGMHPGLDQPKGLQAHSILQCAPESDGSRQIKVVSGGETIGSVAMHPLAAGVVEITNLNVVQEHRRKGIGRALMKAALESARAHGVGQAQLEARPDDSSISSHALVSMYRAIGFRTLGLSSRGNPLMATVAPIMPSIGPSGSVQGKLRPFAQTPPHATANGSLPVISSTPRLVPCIQPMKKGKTKPTATKGKQATTTIETVKPPQKMNAVEQNEYVASFIRLQAPLISIGYATVQEWSARYFAALEYQNNKYGGWHENRHVLLAGTKTQAGEPTRYVELRCPGATGIKDETKLERCIYDLYTQQFWPNAHYDKGYVQITGVPQLTCDRIHEVALAGPGSQELLDAATALALGQGVPDLAREYYPKLDFATAGVGADRAHIFVNLCHAAWKIEKDVKL